MSSRYRKYVIFILTAFCSGVLGSYTYNNFLQRKNPDAFTRNFPVSRYASWNTHHNSGLNFVVASERSRPTVVFIKAIKEGTNQSFFTWDLFFNFFNQQQPSISSGSGVIISSDGYIVTNNHVIKNADRLEVIVTNHKKNYIAKVIGADPSSDIALLKIEEKNLPAIEFGNSDSLLVGEWVLAVGNPFNLTSTVTCGIVSAKGRNINIVQSNIPIESFIQTDAAINPGNSGGALVDEEGRLVGINTAILSQTGSYAGYGFAIPSNIVKKVIEDIKEYGVIQRAFLEAEVIDISAELAQKIGMEDIQGVYVNKVSPNSNAEKSGVKAGDIIIKVNNTPVSSRSLFDEQLAYHRPGDKVKFEIIREGKVQEIEVTLNNSEGNTSVFKSNTITSNTLGASFSNIGKLDKDYYGIDKGVKVTNIRGGLMAQLNIPDGFIILTLNNQKLENAETLVRTLEGFKGFLLLKGITPEGWIQTRSVQIF